MNPRQLISTALLAISLMTAAACGNTSGTTPGPKPGDGSQPSDPDNPGGPDGSPYPDPSGLPTDANDPNNARRDTDCDGLSDQYEFKTVYDNGRRTDPGLADTDKDGLPDGLELSIVKPVAGTDCVLPGDADLLLKTSPVKADTDGDGLSDGLEDANHNGRVDEGETHPLLRDSDCDGLLDGPSQGNVKGEDQNGDGRVDGSETDPRRFDTDADGISDGVELGVTTNLDDANCTGIFRPDEDPSSITDPGNPDTDGDGVSDGAEDTNQNGRVDEGELDPNDPTDVKGPVAEACTADNLRPVTFQDEKGPDIKLALPPSFTEVTPIKVGNDVKGLVGYDSTQQVAFLAFRTQPKPGDTDPLGDEETLRPLIETKGALSNRTAQLFTTWDGFKALQAIYQQTGTTTDLKRRTDQLVDTLVPGSTGRLSAAAAGVTGDFRVQALYVHRSDKSLVVLIAVTKLSAVTNANSGSPTAFSAKDLANGSALAQFSESTSVQCERFQLPSARVDFIFVVDDSGSMTTSQAALAKTASTAIEALNASSLDWRMSLVTSSYHLSGPNLGKLRRFTRNENKVKAWLTENSTCTKNVCSGVPTTPEPAACPGDTSQGDKGGCWVALAGNGYEGLLGAAKKIVKDIAPGTAPDEPESDTLARKGAALVVVLLGDADDQTTGDTTSADNCGTGGSKDKAGSKCVPVSDYVRFFGDGSELSPTNPTGRQSAVHGIVCPSGKACGCSKGKVCTITESSREFNPLPVNNVSQQRHAAVVNASGGVLGSILDDDSIKASMDAIIGYTIGSSGYKTLKPPIGASIKVAVEKVRDAGVCSARANVPRSTANGYDFDGSARSLSFFGACRPQPGATEVAVSYRYWVDTVKDPNGGVPCENDPNYTPSEPDHCAGTQLGCNESTNQCVCKPNCGDTCGQGARCDMTSCVCKPILN